MKRTLCLLGIVLMFLLLTGTALAATGNVARIGSNQYTSLTAAFQNANDGDTITLLQDLSVTDWNNTAITVSSATSKKLTLDGDNHKITAGTDFQFYLFQLSSKCEFTVKNLTMEGAAVNAGWDYTYTHRTERSDGGYGNTNIIVSYPDGYQATTTGGLIKTSGKLALENCTIQNFIKTDTNELIKTTAGLDFDQVKLQNNYSRTANLIYTAGNVTFHQVTGLHNGIGGTMKSTGDVAEGNGGILYYYMGSLQVTNSTFKKNMAGFNGACFYATRSGGITLLNSEFDNNIAGNHGGVIECTFRMDTAQNIAYAVDQCTFYGNECLAYGGAGEGACISAYTYSNDFPLQFKCTNSTFTKNLSNYGGGVHIRTKSVSSVTFENCLFDQNGTSSDDSGAGAAIDLAGYSEDYVNFHVNNCSFTNNNARLGTVRAGQFTGICLVENCWFKGNNILTGGAIEADELNADLTIKNCTITENHSDSGSAIYSRTILNGSKITVADCDVYNNSSLKNATLYVVTDIAKATKPASLIVNNTNIHNNSVGQSFGGIYCKNTNLTLGASTFVHHNTALTGSAGGVGVYGDDLDVSFTMDLDSLIYHNSAENSADDIRIRALEGHSVSYNLTKPGKICQEDGCEKFHEYLKRYETDTKGKAHKPYGPLTGTLSNGQTANIRVVPAIVPSTGDSMLIALIACLLLSAAGVCVILKRKKSA